MSIVVHSNWWLTSTSRHVQRTKSNTNSYAKSTWFLAYLLVMHNFRLDVLSNFSKYIFRSLFTLLHFCRPLGRTKNDPPCIVIHHSLPSPHEMVVTVHFIHAFHPQNYHSSFLTFTHFTKNILPGNIHHSSPRYTHT